MADLEIRIKARDEAQPAFDSVEEGARSMESALVDALEKVNETAGKLSDSLEDLGEEIGGGGSGGIGGIFATAFGALPGLATKAASGILSAFSFVGRGIGAAFSGVVSIVEGALSAVVSVVKGVVGGIIAAFQAIPGAIGAVFSQTTAIVTAATGFIVQQLGTQAAQYEGLRNGAEALARANGTTWPKILAAIREGTRGTVSELEAMRLANNAVLLGVAKTPEEFAKLTDAGFRLGTAVGRTATEAFEDLALGIGRQSKLILDNLGIQVRAEEANERFAASIGKTVAELDDEERTLAFRTAAFAAIDDALAKLGDTTTSLAARFGQFRAAFADTFTDLARVVGPALQVFSDAIVPLVQRFRQLVDANRDLLASRLAEFAQEAVDSIGALAERIGVLYQNTADLRAEIVDRLLGAWDTLKTVGAAALEGLFVAIAAVRNEFGIFRDAIVGFLNGEGFDASGSVILAGFNVIGAGVELFAKRAYNALHDEFEAAFQFIEDELEKLRRKFSDPLSGAKGVFANLGAGLLELGGEDSARSQDLILKLFGTSTDELVEKLRAAADQAKSDIGRPPRAGDVNLPRADIEAAQDALAEALREFSAAAGPAVEGGRQLQDQTRESIAQAVERFRQLTETQQEAGSETVAAIETAGAESEKTGTAILQTTDAIVRTLENQNEVAVRNRRVLEELRRRVDALSGSTATPAVLGER